MKIRLLMAVLLFPVLSNGDQGVVVMLSKQLNLNDVNYTGSAGNGTQFKLKLTASCFGTNLRFVSNPLSPTSTINMAFNMTRVDGGNGIFKVSVPASIVLGQAPPGPVPVDIDGLSTTATGAISGQTLVIQLPEVIRAGMKAYVLNDQTYTQVGAGGGMYMGYDGPLSASLSYNYSSNNSTLEIAAAFPGQTGFCGGYFSPLMVFFSEKRPALKNKSSFKLRPEGDLFHWPEGSEDWAFLVHDKNGNGIVDSGAELFGPDEKYINGFKALAELDSNKDGVIDSKDKEFKKLRLWVDLNGDGKTDQRELRELSSKGVVSIPLKYAEDQRVSLGERGEFRERATFKNATGKSYDIIDVWLGVDRPAGLKK